MSFARVVPSARRAGLACLRAAPQQRSAGLLGAWRAVASARDYPEPVENFPWKSLGFSQGTKETKMIISTCTSGGHWADPEVKDYGPLSLEPSATILNYGQGIFEGIKAYRSEQGRIVIFRPHKNGQRMADGARRMLMPAVPTQLFVEAVSQCVRENAHWVPPAGQGALYMRPILFGSGADLGVKPSSEYTFCIYATPVGQYFSSGSGGVRMKICLDHQRAAPAGVGHVKYAGNYAQCFSSQLQAKSDGYSDVIYLECGGQYIDEAAASNFFCVDANNVVHTPQLGTILPGVTRDSIIQLVRSLRDKDIQLKVGKVSVETVLNAKEAFVTGTGAGITPIEHISGEDDSVDFKAPGPVTQMLQKALVDIQLEKVKDTRQWLHDPFYSESGRFHSFTEPVM